MAGKPPTEEDRREAMRRFLASMAGGVDAIDLAASVADLHPKNDTFPGEVYMELAADALEVAHVGRDDPIPYEGLRETHLPECEFRGRENSRIQCPILTSASVHGGLKPDLLDEVIWWRTDDYWSSALYAAVALIRASAAHAGVPVARVVEQLAEGHGVALT